MYQQCIIVGNVGKDPEMSYTPQGIAVCKFSVAVNKVTGKGENKKEKTTRFRVTVWRERAETAVQYIKKGHRIMVIGEVEVSAYLDKQGQPAATLELTAHDFKFLEKRGESNEEPSGERRSANTRGNDDGSNDIPF